MGIFKKSPEEKLVDELVGSGFLICDNLSDVLISPVSQNELQEIVKGAWKNGASVSEIQRVYDENLLRLKSFDYSSENKEDNAQKESEKFNVLRYKIVILVIFVLLIVGGGIYSIFFISHLTHLLINLKLMEYHLIFQVIIN